MANDDQPDEERGHARRGVRAIARSILDHGANYVEARIELARLEADEAGVHLRGLSVRLAIGASAALAGYTVCLVAAISLLGRDLFGGRWEFAALIAGGLHLFVAAIFLLGARHRAKLAGDLFSSTRRELTKDQLWLKQTSNPADPEDAPN